MPIKITYPGPVALSGQLANLAGKGRYAQDQQKLAIQQNQFDRQLEERAREFDAGQQLNIAKMQLAENRNDQARYDRAARDRLAANRLAQNQQLQALKQRGTEKKLQAEQNAKLRRAEEERDQELTDLKNKQDYEQNIATADTLEEDVSEYFKQINEMSLNQDGLNKVREYRSKIEAIKAGRHNTIRDGAYVNTLRRATDPFFKEDFSQYEVKMPTSQDILDNSKKLDPDTAYLYTDPTTGEREVFKGPTSKAPAKPEEVEPDLLTMDNETYFGTLGRKEQSTLADQARARLKEAHVITKEDEAFNPTTEKIKDEILRKLDEDREIAKALVKNEMEAVAEEVAGGSTMGADLAMGGWPIEQEAPPEVPPMGESPTMGFDPAVGGLDEPPPPPPEIPHTQTTPHGTGAPSVREKWPKPTDDYSPPETPELSVDDVSRDPDFEGFFYVAEDYVNPNTGEVIPKGTLLYKDENGQFGASKK